MKYKIIQNDSLPLLEAEVNATISGGGLVHGGVFIYKRGKITHYAQAVTVAESKPANVGHMLKVEVKAAPKKKSVKKKSVRKTRSTRH